MPFVFGRFMQPLPARIRWQHLPRNTVLQGDCVERMAELPDRCVDFVLTDPPYLVGYRDRSGRTIANDSDDQWLGPAFAEAYRLLKPDSFCVSFYGWNRADLFLAAWRAAGFRPIGHLVFQKNYASNVGFLRHQHEQAYLLAKGKPSMAARPIPDVLRWRYTGNRLHPTQKPVAPLVSLIEAFTQPGDLVLDPFCGSGSTLVAAQQSGRDYLGVEIDPAHYRTAARRLAESGAE